MFIWPALLLLGSGGATAWLPAAEAPGATPTEKAKAAAKGATQGQGATATDATPTTTRESDVVKLGQLEVSTKAEHDSTFDSTGMGSREQQLRDTPFSNDLISVDPLDDDAADIELAGNLRQIATPSAVDLATADSRVSLRGFPAPLLRNGFVTMGAVDMLNTSRTIVIQGALVPVLGKAAPGGIQDFITFRPRAKPGQRYDYSWSSLQRQAAVAEIYGVTVPKKAWHRVAADWSRKTGPEQFAASEVRSFNGSLTWKHSPAASTLFATDFQQTHATAAPGIPEYRPGTGQKIVGPYLPLAGFNALGPEAGVRRRTAAGTILFDGQPHPKLAVRAGIEGWWREIEQDRFTTSLYNVALGRFDGTREPRHSEQPQYALLGHLEAIGRFRAFGAEHKLMAAVNHTRGVYDREERALSVELRNALPASVRLFRPDAPDYSRPVYSPQAYNRIITDRQERANYTAIELSERMALQDGRWVLTTGLRQDFVELAITDRRVGAPQPYIYDRVDQLTWHTGVNYQLQPSRLLLFGTVSTAFEPSTRVDSRTGKIQGNEMTNGYEGGVKGRFLNGAFDFTVSGFMLFNTDISRRNPLYDDPIYDANQTQPQLVTSGEEKFTGGKIETRWKPSPPLTLTGRVAYAEAITTSSPDLPEEVGRQMTRTPPLTATLTASYGFSKGKLRGLSLSGNWNYISSFVANYEDNQRRYLEYGSNGLFGASANYPLKQGKWMHSVGLTVRNLFDYDLVTTQARLGAGREWVGSWRMMY